MPEPDDETLAAVEAGDVERVRSLLEQGASPQEDWWGFSLVDEALMRRDEPMVRLLLEFGARLDDGEAGGRSRLHDAAVGNDAWEADLLIRLGHDPDGADRHGWTPLHYAATFGGADVAAVLLAAGADPEARTIHGKRPADLARVNGREWPPARRPD
ncbi:MAG TPA: ankyrin repeat domain-containing protein [Solirubrobacteraceae bacterium]|jgi:ankyrin repeat protein